MLKLRIIIVLISVVTSSCVKFYSSQGNALDVDSRIRRELSTCAYLLAENLEKIRYTEGNYPINLPESTYDWAKELHIYKLDYQSDGNSYEIRMISDYVALCCTKLTVIRINNGAIFWRDNMAKREYDIGDVNWTDVTYKIIDLRLDDQGKRLSNSRIRRPRLIIK